MGHVNVKITPATLDCPADSMIKKIIMACRGDLVQEKFECREEDAGMAATGGYVNNGNPYKFKKWSQGSFSDDEVPEKKSFRQTIKPYIDLFDREKKIENVVLSRLSEGNSGHLGNVLMYVSVAEDVSNIPITAESVVQNIIWGMVDKGLLRCDKDSWLSLATNP